MRVAMFDGTAIKKNAKSVDLATVTIVIQDSAPERWPVRSHKSITWGSKLMRRYYCGD